MPPRRAHGSASLTGVLAFVAGKPYAPMVSLVVELVGARAAASAVMVGDRPDTDGRFALAIGCRFALVYSGVTRRGMHSDPVPDLAVDDLAAVVAALG